ncbi:Re/Si-specific NAD(P)(+) transhydrogenase subunit alpha [Litoribacter ruber]|uniref:Re/Si-specific NAD(P)(+) transhydrogenase subunit alpha n=1 Tax=Litoribacter ruber TaxID=702568 RepID=UPI001BDA5822|nr:Re/Si-specific NAD(P)(+) transhydrogenase subunit alpha [Litoribacter ruber]MBT0811602.1 Re/Si-specific NAD(P)(+) transhydrogenase subunit alpha [Litoribacter ruber]
MIIGILKEPVGESRVALLPDSVKNLISWGVSVLVEYGAGAKSYSPDPLYQEAGAEMKSRLEILQASDMVLAINPPSLEEVGRMKPEAVFLGQFNALFNQEFTQYLIQNQRTAFSMELVPRTTRAQSMDVLSSMATVIGYKAVLMAANLLPRFFPMFMTAAGSISPARVLILGAGVAGLQAIATSRRLGATVFAFDVRAAAKEEVLSLGAKFVEVEGAKEDKGAGGYAVEQDEDFLNRQKEAIHEQASKSDIIITTAQIPGRKAPLLVEERTVLAMKPGSVIIDLAASSGGNCALTQPAQTVEVNGVRVVGVDNLAGTLPQDASKMYGKNYLNFLKLIIKDGQLNLNFEDDIVAGTCVCHQGEAVSPRIAQLINT